MPRPKKVLTLDTPAQFDPDDDDVMEVASAPVTEDRLATVLEKIVENGPIKKVSWAKFKTRSPFNPTGNKKRKLSRQCFQNGALMPIKVLKDEEIRILNKITEGRYIDNLVTVRELIKGSTTQLHIIYNNKTPDQRFANANAWNGLFNGKGGGMLEKIEAEMVAAGA